MKSFLYWLLGDRGGRIAVGTWAWLIGQPINKGDAQTISIAREALVDVEENVHALTSAVAEQQAALGSAEDLYNDMQQQAEQLQQRAEQLVNAGEENAALDVLSELEITSQALPQLKQQVEVAQANFEASRANLIDMQRSLKTMQAQQKHAASIEKVTAALAKANALNAPSSNSARATLEEAHDAVKRRSALETAKSQLNAQGSETTRKINQLSAAQRLAELKAKSQPLQIEKETTDA